jgi:adenine phosphoribosyltransferase
LSASIRLVRKAGGNIVGIGVILTEAHDWRETLGPDAALVRGLGHIPQFHIENGKATIIPSSTEAAQPCAE